MSEGVRSSVKKFVYIIVELSLAVRLSYLPAKNASSSEKQSLLRAVAIKLYIT